MAPVAVSVANSEDSTFEGGGLPSKSMRIGDGNEIFDAISRFLPPGDDHQAFWWSVTGRHTAHMLYEAGYPIARQVACLLFYRFTVVPRLGPQPTSSRPWFRSRVGAKCGDGAPIGYSWRFGVGDSKPYIRHFLEPLGPLTGTAADPCNEVAIKEFLCELDRKFADVDLSVFWKFAAHLRPNLADEDTRRTYAGTALLVALELAHDSDSIDVKTYMWPRVPAQIDRQLTDSIPNALRDCYGAEVSLSALKAVQHFLSNNPEGRKLKPPGTTAIDCCAPSDTRVKFYAVSGDSSFNHIAKVMTFGGQKSVPPHLLDQLRQLWYALKGLEDDFPTSSPLPFEGHGPAVNFYFDIQPSKPLPDVKCYFDLGMTVKSDWDAAEAVAGVLERHGKSSRHTQGFMNALRAILTEEQLQGTSRATHFAAGFKNNELDVTAYMIPGVYKRYSQIRSELDQASPTRQRKSRFD